MSRPSRDLVQLTCVAGLGSLLFGLDTGIVSGFLIGVNDDLGGKVLSEGQQEAVVSAALVGALVGALGGRLADLWGRKTVIMISAVFFGFGAIEQAAAQILKELLLGRFIVGLGVGLSSAVLPFYLSEVAPPEWRGRIVGSIVVLVTGGQVLAYAICAAFAHVEHGWRWMVGLCAAPAILQLLLSFSIPESPRFLLLHGRTIAARKVVERMIIGSDGGGPERTYEHEEDRPALSRRERVDEELRRMEADLRGARLSLVEEAPTPVLLVGAGGRGVARAIKRLVSDAQRRAARVKKVWNDRANRKALILACGLQGFQQATGFNSVMYYSAQIIKMASFTNPVTFAILIALSNFVCTLIALQLIDRVGRRSLLLYSTFAMAVFMCALGFTFIFISATAQPHISQGHHAGGPWPWLALLSLVGFCCSYATGQGNVPWTVQSEVFDHELRAVGNGLATSTNWFANLVIASTFLHLAKLLRPTGAFWIYSAIAVLAWLFTFAYLPETRNLDLASVRALFDTDAYPGLASRKQQQRDAEHGYEALPRRSSGDGLAEGEEDLVADSDGDGR